MRVAEIINEAKYNYSLSDYQEVPYDTPRVEKLLKKAHIKEPNIGPQEGKYLNLMLKKMKPAVLVDLDYEKELFIPYLKNGTFVLAGKSGPNQKFGKGWIITQHGEEWRAPRLFKLFNQLKGDRSREEGLLHAKIGVLLGIPKESIRYFLSR